MLDFLIGQDFLSAVIAFAIVLIPAVIIHELGHFIAARMVGITVLEFGIGFPPRVAKLFTWRETEFTLNAIPLGGFVRPLGEDLVGMATDQGDNSEENSDQRSQPYSSEREELAARGYTRVTSVSDAKPWPRIFFFIAGALANFVSAFLLFVLVGVLGAPEEAGTRVGLIDVPPGSQLAQVGLQSEDIIEGLNDDLFANSRAFSTRCKPSRAAQ